jgi:ABC-type Zn uptake system ZnuABC Zn-binding protein ZnuA
LFTDALGEAGSGRETYIDAMRANVNVLTEALK